MMAFLRRLPLFLAVAACLQTAAGAGASDEQAKPASEAPVVLNADIYFSQAVEYLERFRREDIGQAVRLFNQVVKVEADNPRGHAGLAEARAIRFLQGWDPDAAMLEKGVASGKRAVELDPKSFLARQGLGIALLAADRYTPALQELDRAVELNGGSFRAHLYRGMLLRGLRRREEACSEAHLALNLAPASATARALLGDCEQDLHHYPEARSAYFAAAELDQRLLWPRLGIAAAYQRETNFPASEKTYLLTERDFPEDNQRIEIMAASQLVSTQRYEEAAKAYQSISEKEAMSPPLLRRLMLAGRAYSLEKLGRLEESEYFWSKLVEEFPTDFDGGFRDREVASQGFEALSRTYETKGDAARAAKTLEKGCAHQRMAFALYAACADKLRGAGRLEDALKALQSGLAQAVPDDDWVAITQAMVPTLRASATSPKSSSSVRSRALTLVNDLSGKIAESQPTSFVPYVNLARAQALHKQNQKALDNLGAALKRGYGAVKTTWTDPDFKSLQSEPAFKQLAAAP